MSELKSTTTTPGRRSITWVRLALQVGQGAVVAVGVIVFGVAVPLFAVLSIFALGALFNLLLFNGERVERMLSERELMLSLFGDIAQLSALLTLTGGLANPFALFLMAPALVGAAILSRRNLLVLMAVLSGALVAITIYRWPLRFLDGSSFDPSPGVQFGILVAYLAAQVLLTLTMRRLTEDYVSRVQALAKTEKALEEQQRVSAIGAMAAAIAHEMATPLATIKLTATELKRDLRENKEAHEDVALIAEQAERCRDILSKLSTIQAPEKEHIRTGPIISVLQEAAGPHENRRAEIRYRLNGAPAGREDPRLPQPEIPRRPELIHGMRNIIQNAVDFAKSRVWIDIAYSEETLVVSVGDDGEGFSPEIQERLGEPFTTTRGQVEGMGLGVFIAISLLERTGAKLEFRNAPHTIDKLRARQRRAPAPKKRPLGEPSGAIVSVTWKTADLPVVPPRPRAAREGGRAWPAAHETHPAPRT